VTTNLERLRTVSRGYPYLQGLKVVPVGGLLLWVSLLSTEWMTTRLEGWVPALLFALGAIAALVAAVSIGRYYDRRFGRVSQTRTQLRRDAIGTTVAALALGAGLLIDARMTLPVSAFGLALAAVLLWYWTWSGGPRVYHWLLAGGLALVALLPAFSTWFDLDLVDKGEPALTLVLAAAGAVYVAAGLLDHAHLVRSMGPVSREHDVDNA
jgi:hypothetical protein